MRRYLLVYALSLPFTLILDYIWLGRLMQRFYLAQLGTYARRRGDVIVPVYWAAALVYILIPLGVLLFAMPRVNPESPYLSSLRWGGVYGLVLYGVYDLTNMATLEDWPFKMVLVDICWGCFLCAATTCFASHISTWIG